MSLTYVAKLCCTSAMVRGYPGDPALEPAVPEGKRAAAVAPGDYHRNAGGSAFREQGAAV